MMKKSELFQKKKVLCCLSSITATCCSVLLLTGALSEAAEREEPRGKIPELAIRASKLIGHTVRNSQGREIAEIDDIIINERGQIYHVILSFGGILGMGSKLVAIHFDSLEIENDWTYRTRYKADGTQERIPWEITKIITFQGSEDELANKPTYHYDYSNPRGGSTGWGRYSYPAPDLSKE
ncbi:MAG: PRC-barrel domain-containing protein [Desulfatiglandaceae bacterium]